MASLETQNEMKQEQTVDFEVLPTLVAGQRSRTSQISCSCGARELSSFIQGGSNNSNFADHLEILPSCEKPVDGHRRVACRGIEQPFKCQEAGVGSISLTQTA